MRFAVSVVALAATVAAQGVQTITQIGDGQIQAPPATATAPEVSTPAVSSPAVATSVPEAYSSVVGKFITSLDHQDLYTNNKTVVPSSAASVASSVAPVPVSSLVTSVVPPAGNTSVPIASSAVPSSGSASGSGSSPSSTASSGGASGTSSSGIPESSGAAAANMVSFGGLVIAVGAAFLA